jgi:hypothetical protein
MFCIFALTCKRTLVVVIDDGDMKHCVMLNGQKKG